MNMANVWVEGILKYNIANDRYGLFVSDEWECDGFHCGDCFQIEIDGEWIDTSIEMDWSSGSGIWYLTYTNIRGGNILNTKARIQKNVW